MTHLLCDVPGYRETVKNAVNAGMNIFYQFYQEAPNCGRGLKTFETQFLPFIERYGTHLKASLDIGYGSGSMVFAASKFFEMALGVDVHLQNEEVTNELILNGCDNFNLYIGDGTNIPVEDSCIDFIHSWTVLMHLGTAKVVKKYLAECYRVMKPGGLAVLYFARMYRSKPNETKEEWEQSIIAELDLYREKIRKVNQINLTISMRWMEQEVDAAGFKILERTASTVAVHHIEYYHGQHGLVLRKE